ncbi:MAG: DUF4388 domain-containing protein [Limisphaerales bacterium]
MSVLQSLPTPQALLKNILIVDRTPSSFKLIEQSILSWGKGSWRAFPVEHYDAVVPALVEHWIDTLILDLDMPGEDGLEFLYLLHTSFPALPKIALTEFPNGTVRARCTENGAIACLAKPKCVEETNALYSKLSVLLEPVLRGFRGLVRIDGLQELLQLECLHRRSSVIEFNSVGEHGRVYIREGEIVHAELGALLGKAALPRILSLEGGEFAVLPLTGPVQQTIHQRWEFLLLEAAQKDDESESFSPQPTLLQHR